ncbi:MAG TPA: pimeloyl-ACP methyl ester esterase BioH [Steroidobacteraceae bacterium]|nr:pimeloyl-ACP methyl ester esterase BioH [Steroidobacteraceae bacterium]
MSALYTEVTGRGPDLVLLHGWALNLRVWDGLAAVLRPHFRLIAVDLPGHGRSAWTSGRCTPAEQAWLVHQTLEPISDRYSLLGWSLGGQIAIDLAAATPAQIDRLILVATTPKFVASDDWPRGAAPSSIAALATKLRRDYQRTVSDFLELQVRTSETGQELLTQLRASLFAHGAAQPEALQCGLDILAGNDLRPSLQHVQARTLVIAGQYDRITLPEASRELAALLPSARYEEFPRAAHAPFLSHREEFAALIRSFLHTAPHARTGTRAGVRTRSRAKAKPLSRRRTAPRKRPAIAGARSAPREGASRAKRATRKSTRGPSSARHAQPRAAKRAAGKSTRRAAKRPARKK